MFLPELNVLAEADDSLGFYLANGGHIGRLRDNSSYQVWCSVFVRVSRLAVMKRAVRIFRAERVRSMRHPFAIFK